MAPPAGPPNLTDPPNRGQNRQPRADARNPEAKGQPNHQPQHEAPGNRGVGPGQRQANHDEPNNRRNGNAQRQPAGAGGVGLDAGRDGAGLGRGRQAHEHQDGARGVNFGGAGRDERRQAHEHREDHNPYHGWDMNLNRHGLPGDSYKEGQGDPRRNRNNNRRNKSQLFSRCTTTSLLMSTD